MVQRVACTSRHMTGVAHRIACTLTFPKAISSVRYSTADRDVEGIQTPEKKQWLPHLHHRATHHLQPLLLYITINIYILLSLSVTEGVFRSPTSPPLEPSRKEASPLMLITPRLNTCPPPSPEASECPDSPYSAYTIHTKHI